MTGTRLGQVPIVASWMQYESGTNWGEGLRLAGGSPDPQMPVSASPGWQLPT